VNTERLKFQLDRMILFSDAVFAIAITLLIIEIKIPELHGDEMTEGAILHAVFLLIPKFMGFFISFFLIGMYWTVHHRMFGYVVNLTPRLMWLNLIFLLSIVLMPFSTGIFGAFSTPRSMHLKTPLIIYVLNICFVGVVNFCLWRMIGNPQNGVCAPDVDATEVRLAKIRSAIVPSVFALAIPTAFLNPYLARYVPLLIPLAMKIALRRMNKLSRALPARS
jgi:uncharacterized membrane protein